MKIKSNNILCIGEVLWDRLPEGDKAGGAPMNVALHLQRLGQKVNLATRIGNDKAGDRLKNFLQHSGLETGLVQTDDQLPTSEVIVHLDENHNATYDIVEPVAWDKLEKTEALANKAQEAGVIVYGTLASRNDTTRNTITSLLENEAVKVIDVNLRPPYDQRVIVEPLLHKANIVKLNDEELERLAEWQNLEKSDQKSLMEKIAGHIQCEILCVTRGAEGAIIYSNGSFYEHPGYKVETRDHVGAGDAFLAGLVSQLLQEKSINKALDFACATGAFVASQTGATPEYDINHITQILNQKS
ncbi:MAG: carbohydrate kinase [Bacteroidales bacterium]|nr:carbohydrate kinase [Bacteroidales bacterium]